MKFQLLFAACCIIVLIGCKKESPGPTQPGGTAFTINCATGMVQGNYVSGTALNLSHTITLQVTVTSPGSFNISTATINGFGFSAAGNFSTTGVQTIVLAGTGTLSNPGTFTFFVSSGSNGCTIPIIVSYQPPPLTYLDNDHMLFGNPGNAAPSTSNPENFLMRKNWYSVSYSSTRGIPNWVSWHLYSGDLGATSRQDDFRPDNTLPAGWYQVPANAFSGSGFDRGHNCPSGDRTISVEANSSTFLMTNMVPQAPMMNQQTWANMEDSLRRLVTLGNEVYIIMGSYGSGGTGTNGFATTIHGGLVTVPANIWKVAVVLPNGDQDSSRVDVNTRVIAVNISNSNLSTGSWKNYRTSVDAIEAATGYDLLRRLAVGLQVVLEGRVDNL